MKHLLGIMTLIVVCGLAGIGAAGERRIRPGESIRIGETTVMCEDRHFGQAPVTLSECQHWDQYDKRCLYEKRTMSVGELECVEECQHWDSYGKKCDYATRCSYYPDQRVFIRTTCELFDAYDHACRKTMETRIGGRAGKR